jgi:DMSO reductase family type II enzyme heme b subunit
MPAYADAVASEIVTTGEVWNLAHYVATLAPSVDAPRLVEVVRARRLEGELPSLPSDPVWEQVEPLYFPLAGQVIEQPRAFSPTVSGVWVQALHNGEVLAMRFAWDDPSESPDPAWDEWQMKFATAVDPDGTPIPTGPLPDAFAVQFPPTVPRGMERPYFLMGSAAAPVYLWTWSSEAGAREARARGLGQIEPLQDGGLAGAAEFESGRWALVLRRGIDAADEARLGFVEGVPIPMAFFAWDGSSGEAGTRGAVSTWYYVFLEQPPSNMVFVTPVLAMLLTGGLGLVAVRRARRGAPGPGSGLS